MNRYADGNIVKLEWVFTNPDNNDGVIDPTAVFLLVKDPNDTQTTYTYGVGSTIVRDSTGTYHALIDTSGKEGLWVCEAYSTGTAQARTKEWEFFTE